VVEFPSRAKFHHHVDEEWVLVCALEVDDTEGAPEFGEDADFSLDVVYVLSLLFRGDVGDVEALGD